MPISRSLMFAGLLLGFGTVPAWAGDRQEFPLKYRLSVHVTDEVGPGGQALDLSPHLDGLKDEPKYHSPEPLYAVLKLGVKDELFTLALDCSSGATRGYDILYLDADRDGRFGAGEKHLGVPRTSGTVFGPVKLLVDTGAERCPQWFLFQLAEYEPADGKFTRELLAINAGYYTGVVTFGREKRLVAFADTDGNGLYNNIAKGPGQRSDRLLIDRNGDGKLDPDLQGDEAQPLGRYVLVGDRYWQMDVAADGSSVTVEPLDKPLGTIRAPMTHFSLLLNGAEGVLRVRSRDGTIRVPAGDYQLVQCNYLFTDQTGKSWGFSATANEGVKVAVPAGKEVPLPFGPPFVTRIKLDPPAKGRLTMTLSMIGSGGESYSFAFVGDREKPPAPKGRILDAAGRELASVDFHFG